MFIISSDGMHNKRLFDSAVHIYYGRDWDKENEQGINNNPSKKIFRFKLETYRGNNDLFSDNDVMIMHGGDPVYLYKTIIKLNFRPVIEYFVKKKIYVGISAGSDVLCKYSTFIKDDKKFFETELNKSLLGFSKKRYNMHFNIRRENPEYMNNLIEANRQLNGERIYLVEDGSYVMFDKLKRGRIFYIENGKINKA